MISVITVTLNAASTIADCLDSVKKQIYQEIEHIVIDGGSTDGTCDIIEAREPNAPKIISEPDDGMYDAMNKGVALATGDIVGILNADDYYAHNQVLAHVAAVFDDPEIDACYGDLLCVHPKDTSKVTRYWKAGELPAKRFYRGWMPPHPTFFVRRSLYEKLGGYKLDMGTSADYELMLRFIQKHRINCKYLPETLVHMRAGGASSFSLKTRLRANRMDRFAWKANDLHPSLLTLPLKPIRKLSQWFIKPSTSSSAS